jgi:hypothetical protein
MPRLAHPVHTSSTLQREQQWEPKPPVLPSAAVAYPELALPNTAQPRHTEPDATEPHLDS